MSRTDSGISAFEATSFMHKFKDLWNAGHEATLLFETQAGQAWATLRVALGHHPHVSGKKHVSPSQIRRRERREAARIAAEAVQTDINSRVAEKANTNGVDENKKADEAFEDESNLKKRNAEKAVLSSNNCVLCERTFTTDQGLKSHIGRVHKPSDSPIPQIDGNFDEDYILYEFKSDYGEEDICDSLEKVKDITKVDVKLVSRVRTSPRSADHNCTARVGPVLASKFIWPELDSEDSVVFQDLNLVGFLSFFPSSSLTDEVVVRIPL